MRAVSAAIAIALLSLAAVEVDGYCPDGSQVTNNNDDSFFNKCFIDAGPGFGTVLAKTTATFIAPQQSAAIVFFMVCLLPMWYFYGPTGLITSNATTATSPMANKVRAQFRYMRLHLINLLHRCSYSLCGTVMFYTMFRQRRPCSCPPSGQVGSIYGMPSGDATHAGVIGAFLIDTAPGHPVWSRVFGVAVMVLVAQERVSLGWHTIGQVTSGLVLGVFSHYYSTRAPQFMVFVDCAFMTVIGLICVNVDPDLQYKPWDDMNIRSWFTQGLGFILFIVICLARHFYLTYPDPEQRKKALWAPLYSPIHSPSAASVDSRSAALLPMGDDVKTPDHSGAAVHVRPTDTPTGEDSKADPLVDADWAVTLLAAFFNFVLQLIGTVVEQYATYA